MNLHRPDFEHLKRICRPHVPLPRIHVPHVEPVYARPVTASGTHWRSPKLTISRRSRWALYATNFWVAELIGILIPLLGDYLQEQGWRYDAIGLGTALAGLGLFLAQLPVGIFLDRVHAWRRTLVIAAVVVAATFASIPALVGYPWALNTALFVSGIAEACMMPVLSTLALALAGHNGINKLMGYSQAASHVGNIVISLVVMGVVSRFGTQASFYTMPAVAVFAAISCVTIRRDELVHEKAKTHTLGWGPIFADGRMTRLLVVSLLFHLGNGPITPMVAMYARTLGAHAGFVAQLIFAAQVFMVGAAYAAGYFGDQIGRKPVMTVAFAFLPLRILGYVFLSDPHDFLWLAVLDGAAVGIYMVIVASICADIDDHHGRFNTLMGLVLSTLALGNVLGPLAAGFIVQHFGFLVMFVVFGAIATLAFVALVLALPETNAQTDT